MNMNFKTWLINEISQNTILYHRSDKSFKPGQILDPSDVHGDDHWLKSKSTEVVLEKFRQEFAPDKPSRFNCIYCSVVPRSVFVSRKNLYEVRPIGKTHIALAYLINEIDHIFDNISYNNMYNKLGEKPTNSDIDKYKWENSKESLLPLFNQYWNTSVSNWNENSSLVLLELIEVLCEKVQVVSKADEKEDEIFRKGDRVIFSKDSNYDFLGYDATGNKKLSLADQLKIIRDFNGVRTSMVVIRLLSQKQRKELLLLQAIMSKFLRC